MGLELKLGVGNGAFHILYTPPFQKIDILEKRLFRKDRYFMFSIKKCKFQKN